MDRKRHFLLPVGKRPRPDAVVFVQAGLSQHFMGEADEVGQLKLDDWHALSAVMVGGTPDMRHAGRGAKHNEWWRLLNDWTKGMKQVWIVSWDAREQVAALDLWGLIGRKLATIEGADPWYRDRGDDDNQPKRDGYVILQGPPTVVCWRASGKDTVFTWLDPANYGATRPAGAVTLDEQTAAAATWFAAYCRIVRSLDLGGLEHTAASQAMSGYRHAYLDHAIEIHDSKPANDLERAALYGGRCECRRIGSVFAASGNSELYHTELGEPAPYEHRGPIYHLDVNSLYPSVAEDAMLPCRLRALSGPTTVDMALAAARACACIAECDVTTNYPAVPVRHNGRILWPVGRFQTTLCGPELLLADKVGQVSNVRKLAVYEARPLYARWVRRLYGARLAFRSEVNLLMADVCKAILNASFGKWAQRSRRWIDVDDAIPPLPYTQWYGDPVIDGVQTQWRSLAWQVQQLTTTGETRESFPAITAYINSLGRVRLWELLEMAGQGNVYYYDTDSIICDQVALEQLRGYGELHETELGKLKVKGVHQSARLIGRQAYWLDGELKLSGAGEGAVAMGDAFAVSLRAPPIQHYLLRQKAPGLDRHVARVRVTRPYEHGNVQPDGRVEPARFVDLRRIEPA